MIGIILLILKIIGITLLCVLGLVVLLVLVILFAPIHYGIEGDYHEKLTAHVRVTWILRIISARIDYTDGNLKIKARALWFSLYDNQKEAGNSEKKQKKSHKKEKPENNIFQEEPAGEKVVEDKLADEKTENEQIPQDYFDEEPQTDEKPQMDQETPRLLEETTSDQHISRVEKLKSKILAVLQRIKKTVKSIIKLLMDVIHKVEHAKENAVGKIREISDLIHDPDNRELVRFLKEQLGKLLRIVKPRKYQVNAHFGFDDPELTGKVAMWLAVLYGFLGMNLEIRPDFENQVLEGNIKLKGHFHLFGMIVIAVKCYRNKQIRKFINK